MRWKLRPAVVAVALASALGLVGGCAAADAGAQPTVGGAVPSASGAAAATPASGTAADGSRRDRASVPPARTGRRAASNRVRFLPQNLVLPGGAAAPVVPARTVDGVLQVPEKVDRLGWWDGSAFPGDPFGSTVIAGHVDSATEGIGFFARLLAVEDGDRVTVLGEGHRATYRIVSTRLVDKAALASSSVAFDQRADHRLVLITCAGRFRPERGGYDQNLVVVAEPAGPAR